MRGKLVLFIVLLSAAAATVGWNVAHDPRCLIGGFADRSDFDSLPRRAGLTLPSIIRVNLTGAPISKIGITADGRYRVRSAVGSHAGSDFESPGAFVVTVLPAGFRVNKREYRGDWLEIEAEQPPAIWVEDHQYRGSLRFVRQPGEKMFVVNSLPLEDYIASVIDGEMPAAFPAAARQAQAIAARTYAAFQILSTKISPHYDVHASTRSQNYLGYQFRGRDGRRYAGESSSARRIARETAGIVCLCDGVLFCTYYTAVCGGQTASGADVFDVPISALRPVNCTGCQDADLYRWSHEASLPEAAEIFQRHFSAKGKPFGNLVAISRIAVTDKIHAPSFELSDGRARYRLSALELRRLLPTSWVHSFQFEARISDGRLMIEGRGHGHGVGLCQWGARGMALAGARPLDILRHYYTGAEVIRVE